MISLRDGRGQEEQFFDILGSDPLKLGVLPKKEEWGRYLYTNVIRVNASDPSISDQIAQITMNAYASINETIEDYHKNLKEVN